MIRSADTDAKAIFRSARVQLQLDWLVTNTTISATYTTRCLLPSLRLGVPSTWQSRAILDLTIFAALGSPR
jgi:hypothetical protein